MELKATKRNVAAGKGKRLVVSGTVRAEDCGPLAGATINAWQTNGSGRYGPRRGGRDLCCYLAGTALTGGDGRYRLDTVVPGAYGVAEPHIHMTVGHADARGLNTELGFAPGGTSGVVAVPVEDVRDGAVEFDIVLRDS